MCCADGKNKFIVHGDAGELRVCDVRRDRKSTLRRSGGVVDFDLGLGGFAEIDQAIGANSESGRIVDLIASRGVSRGRFCRAITPRADGTKCRAKFVNTVGLPGSDVDGAVGVDGDVQRVANWRGRAGAHFAVTHTVRKENGDRAGTAISYVDGSSGIDGDIGGMQTCGIVLAGEDPLAPPGKYVNPT